jgi:hypothetical protein
VQLDKKVQAIARTALNLMLRQGLAGPSEGDQRRSRRNCKIDDSGKPGGAGKEYPGPYWELDLISFFKPSRGFGNGNDWDDRQRKFILAMNLLRNEGKELTSDDPNTTARRQLNALRRNIRRSNTLDWISIAILLLG